MYLIEGLQLTKLDLLVVAFVAVYFGYVVDSALKSASIKRACEKLRKQTRGGKR